MTSVTQRFFDVSSLAYQAVLHVFLRDFTNYYWDKEIQEQSSRLFGTQNIQKNYEVLESVIPEPEKNNHNVREFSDENSNVEENHQINEEYSHVIGENSNNDKNFNTLTGPIKEEFTIRNIGDYVQKDDLANNSLQELVSDKNKNSKTSNNEENRDGDLSESLDELKGTSLKVNLSYTVIASKPDLDSLTYKILNNENYLGNTCCAIPPNTSQGVGEEQKGIDENLISKVENDFEHESINDLTVCFEDFVSVDLPKTAIDQALDGRESGSVDEGMTELLQNGRTPELNSNIEPSPMFRGQYEKYSASQTSSTESFIGTAGTEKPKLQEETLPTDSIWNTDVVHEKIENLLCVLNSNTTKEDTDKNIQLTQKLSDTSCESSEVDSDIESYDELVKKVLSGPKSEGEDCCMCTAGQSCLQVVEFNETEELLTMEQMSSVDTGSVSDWLYSATPAVYLPSTNVSSIETSEEMLRKHQGKVLTNNKHLREEIISRTIFINKWVGDTTKYCIS